MGIDRFASCADSEESCSDQSWTTARWLRVSAVAGLLVILATFGIGCGEDDHGSAIVVGPAATATQTPTVGPTVTATPLPSAAGVENLFGSTVQGSGMLTIEPLALIPAYFSACLGGTGVNCIGGSVVYVGSDPGFKEADASESDPTVPLYALPDGVTVTVQVISIDPALSLKFELGTTLTAAGQSLEIGTTPGIHADLEWQLLLPGGAPFDGHPVTLKLTTTSGGFSNSVEFTEVVQPSSGTAPVESD